MENDNFTIDPDSRAAWLGLATTQNFLRGLARFKADALDYGHLTALSASPDAANHCRVHMIESATLETITNYANNGNSNWIE